MAEGKADGAGGGSATRKLRWLAGTIVVAIALYGGLWAYLAQRLDEGVATGIARAAAEGTEITCGDRDVRGFPFRLGVHCASTAASLADGTRVEAGALRSAAQVYAPGLVLTELDGPLAAEGPAGLVQASWGTLQSSTRFGTQRMTDGRLNVEDIDVVLDSGGRTVMATVADVFAALASAEDDLLVALRVDALNLAPVDGRDAPPIDLDVDATVSDAAGALAYRAPPPDTLRGRTIALRAADATIAGGGRFGASGEIAVGDDGLASGTLDVVFSDLAATADALAALLPEYEGPIRSVAGLLGGGGGGGLLAGVLGNGAAGTGEAAASDGGPDERRLTITLDQGRARLGIIPLGSVPPLP